MRQLRWVLSGFLLLSVLLSASAWADEYTSEEQRLLEAYHSGELLRLHILADNDAPEAQQLKLAVRDAILTRFAAELNEASTADEAFARLCSLLPQMEALAADTVQRAGFDLPVSAEAGVLSLPEKRYGQVVLPAQLRHGRQQRLLHARIIGDQARAGDRGEGHGALQLGIIFPAGAFKGIGPSVIEDIFALTVQLDIAGGDAARALPPPDGGPTASL